MIIGDAAERSVVSAKMIRYCEEIGLIKTSRRANGYRDYDASDVSVLQFIRRTRDLGFSLEEVANLLALWRDRKRHRAKSKSSRPSTSKILSGACARCVRWCVR